MNPSLGDRPLRLFPQAILTGKVATLLSFYHSTWQMTFSNRQFSGEYGVHVIDLSLLMRTSTTSRRVTAPIDTILVGMAQRNHTLTTLVVVKIGNYLFVRSSMTPSAKMTCFAPVIFIGPDGTLPLTCPLG